MREFKTHIVDEKMVVVTTTYKGKTIRGVARCAPEDEFNKIIGEKLARTRCESKLYNKITHNIVNELKSILGMIDMLENNFNIKFDKFKKIEKTRTRIASELKMLENNLTN
jgi:hypothetical protein